jgi:hypothetical protein
MGRDADLTFARVVALNGPKGSSPLGVEGVRGSGTIRPNCAGTLRETFPKA